jgi:hypothetical protein
LTDYEHNRCPVCGRQRDECTNPDIVWDVPPPTRCFAGTTLAKEQKPWFTEQPGMAPTPYPHALLWEVRRRP